MYFYFGIAEQHVTHKQTPLLFVSVLLHQEGDDGRYPPERSGVGRKCECYNYQDDCPLCETTARSDYTRSPRQASSGALSLGPTAAVARGREVKAAPAQPSGRPQPGEGRGSQENGEEDPSDADISAMLPP